MNSPRPQFRFWQIAVVAVLCLPLFGCYPDWPETNGTANVEGEFTLDGFPRIGTKIVFVPIRLKTALGDVIPISYGQCDGNGLFILTTSDGSRDIPTGRYNVLFSLVETKNVPEFKQPDELKKKSPADELHAILDEGQVIPSIYNRESDQYFDVVASPGIVRCNFALTSIDPLLLKSNKKKSDQPTD